MGFLTSNFINLMLTREQNRLNARLTSIMSRIRSAKRQSENVERQISNNLRMQQNSIRAYGSQMMQQAQLSSQMNAYNSIFGAQAQSAGMDPMAYAQNLMQTDNSAFTKAMSTGSSVFSMALSQGQQSTAGIQTWMQSALSQAEQEAEIAKEMQLQPLKDLAEDLEVEKTQIEADLQLNKQWKDSAKEDVKNSVESFKPNYGGNA